MLWIFSVIFVVVIGIGAVFIATHPKDELRVTCMFNYDDGTITFSPAKGYSLVYINAHNGTLLAETDTPFTFKIIKKTIDLITVYYYDSKQQRDRYYKFDIGASADGIYDISQFDEIGNQVAVQTFLFNP